MFASKRQRVSWVVALVIGSGIVMGSMGIRSALAEEHDRNPRIRHALESLREAKHELDEAPHDFHGHKREALEAVDRAIDQLDRIKDW
jgi:hypothetical protein